MKNNQGNAGSSGATPWIIWPGSVMILIAAIVVSAVLGPHYHPIPVDGTEMTLSAPVPTQEVPKPLAPPATPQPQPPKLTGTWNGQDWNTVLAEAKKFDQTSGKLRTMPWVRKQDFGNGHVAEEVLGYCFGKAGDMIEAELNTATRVMTVYVRRDGKKYQELPGHFPDADSKVDANVPAWMLWDYNTGEVLDWCPNNFTLQFSAPISPGKPMSGSSS